MDLEELRKLALSSKKKKEVQEEQLPSFEFQEDDNEDEMSDEEDFKFILNRKEEIPKEKEEENDFDLILTKHLKKKKMENVKQNISD
jgi:hypothetical protein